MVDPTGERFFSQVLLPVSVRHPGTGCYFLRGGMIPSSGRGRTPPRGEGARSSSATGICVSAVAETEGLLGPPTSLDPIDDTSGNLITLCSICHARGMRSPPGGRWDDDLVARVMVAATRQEEGRDRQPLSATRASWRSPHLSGGPVLAGQPPDRDSRPGPPPALCPPSD